MPLSTNVQNLAIRLATEFKTLRTELTGNPQGDLSGLQTADKSSLVAAINELVTTGGGSGDLINDTTPSNSTTYSSNKIESLLTALEGQIPELTDLIDDEAPSSSTVFSSTETLAQIQSAIDDLVGSAPGALDTIYELAAALNNDASTVTNLISQVGEKVSYTAQSLNSGQQAQARTNIGAAAAADLSALASNVGDTNADFVQTFEDYLEGSSS